MSDLLRNGRGRIRCWYSDCDHWASQRVLTPTPWSSAETMPECDCCYFVTLHGEPCGGE